MADIKLRGHHIKSFGNTLLRYYPNIQVAVGPLSIDYDLEFAEKVVGLYKQIMENPELEIEINDTLDDVCEGCPKINHECSCPIYTILDEAIAVEYGFEIGKTYTAESLVSKIARFNLESIRKRVLRKK